MTMQLTLTTAGLQELVNAQSTGTAAVQVVSIGVTPTPFQATAALAVLPAEAARLPVAGGQVVSPATIHVAAQDVSQAAYAVAGLGLYLQDGTLLGSYSQPTPFVSKAAGSQLLLTVDIQLAQGLAGPITFSQAGPTEPPSSETVVGVTRFATSAEAVAGNSNAVAVHPLGLAAALQAALAKIPAPSSGGAGGGTGPLAYVEAATALAALLAVLGFTPVQQGTGPNQEQDVVALGWDGTRLRLAIDAADKGELALYADVTAAVATINAALAGKQAAGAYQAAGNYQANLGFTPVQQGTGPSQDADTVALGWDSARLRLAIQGVDKGDLAFYADLTAAVATINAALAGKQPAGNYQPAGSYQPAGNYQAALGYTPVQQGGGTSQASNKIMIGWDGTRLRLQVDATDEGEFAMLADLNGAVATINAALAGKQASLGFTPVNKAGDTMTGQLSATQFNAESSGTYLGPAILNYAPNWFIDYSSSDGLRVFAGGDYAIQVTPTNVIFRQNPAFLPETFAGLQSSPYYGQSAYITDCPFAPAGNYGAAVTAGGGTYHAKIWWNAHDGHWVIG